MKASLLLIGPWSAQLREFGAVLTSDLREAHLVLQNHSFDVIGLNLTSMLEKKFAEFYSELKEKNPATQILMAVPPDYDSASQVRLFRNYRVHRVLKGMQDPQLNDFIFSAIEKAQEEKQNQNLEILMHEQNQALLRLQNELEQRIERRAHSLSESRFRLRVLNSRTEALRQSMIAAHQSSSLSEMEKLLNQSLASVAQCSWIKIVPFPQDHSFQLQIQQMGSFSQLQIPLFKEQDRIGSLFFMRAPQESFNREESEFLNRVAEAVALAVVRIQRLTDSQTVKEQWETTFNSMSEPVAIINQDYDIVQSNSVFQKVSGSEISAKKCYEVLFHRQNVCPGCRLGQRFKTESLGKTPHTYEVHSQPVRLDGEKENFYFNIYHDMTERLSLEKQLMDSAKRAELGVIGSSIAHELNNPLGGILTFTQIMKSEAAPDAPFMSDLVALEQGALRCKEIIQNLLEFSRQPSSQNIIEITLKEILEKALRLMEVKTKPWGLDVKLIMDDESLRISAEANRLTQVFTHILQSQVQNIMDAGKTSQGLMTWRVSSHKNEILFEACDNSGLPLWDQNVSHFSFSLLDQLLKDFAGRLEILTSSSLDLKAKISFSRPVLKP